MSYGGRIFTSSGSPLLRVIAVGLLVWGLGGSQSRAQSSDFRQVGEVDHPPVDEMSGIVQGRLNDNVWWVHNDSGDEPRLFAIDSTGAVRVHSFLRRRYAVGAETDTSDEPTWPGVRLAPASHIDFEDIAIDDSTLYVADIGNNLNARRNLGIYVVPEPDVLSARIRPLKYISIAYPDQTSFPADPPYFDAESLFVIDGRLHILTKRRTRERELTSGTTLYRLDTEHPHQTNTLTRVDAHASIPAPTAAALSPDGDRLAVLSYEAVWIFPRPADDTHWLSTEPRRIALSTDRLKQAEAIAWDDAQTLRITNEQRDVFVLPLEGGR